MFEGTFSESEDTLSEFEGTLHYVLEINGLQQDLRYRMKRGVVRLEIDDPHMNGSMTLLISPEEYHMIALMHELHAYAIIGFDEIAEQGESFVNQLDRVTATEDQREIAGVMTREYRIVTEARETIRLWSPDQPDRFGFFQFPDFGNHILSYIINHDLPAELFPFAIVYHSERTSIELTLVEIQEEQLNLDLFVVPPNYQKRPVTMPDY